MDARGSSPYFGTAPDGQHLFVKALGEDQRSADLLFRIYRWAQRRDLGDERPFSTLRRGVEHEALVALAARELGVRTPRLAGFATADPNGYVLAYEAIEGRSLDRLEPAEMTDDVLAAIWEQVVLMRRHRIAHRDLRLANVFLAADGAVWMIDFGFSELAASDLLLTNDIAELLASSTLQVGAARAVAAGRAAVGPEVLGDALDRLQPWALSGATRTGMKETPGLLDRAPRRGRRRRPPARAVPSRRPPGVSTRRRSPGSTSMVVFPASRSRVPSARISQSSPQAPGSAAGQAPRRQHPALSHQRDGGGDVEGELAFDPLAARVAAGAAAAPPQPVADHPERVVVLQRLDRGVLGVGHAGVDPGLAGGAGPPALATGDGLVVGEVVVADQHVVHRPLGGGGHPVGSGLGQGAEQHVGDPLAGLHVAGGDRRRGEGVDQGARLGDQAGRVGSSRRWPGWWGRWRP